MARFLHPNRCSEVRDPSKDVGKVQKFKASFQIRHLLNLTWLSWSIACVKVVKALLQILFLMSDAAMPFYDVLWCFENMFSSPEASVDCPSQKTKIYHQLAGLTSLWIFEWSFFFEHVELEHPGVAEVSNGEKPQAGVASDCKASVGCCSVGQVLFWKVVWACRNWTWVLHSTKLTKEYVEHALECFSPVWAIFCWCY